MEAVENSLSNDRPHAITPMNFQNGNSKKKRENNPENFRPPDGGTRAWLVLVGSFLCNGILFGVINSYSVLHGELHDNLVARNVSDASSKAALVGSLAMGATFMMSAVAGILTDFIGLRTTAFVGGALASGGMFISSFCAYDVNALYFTYGIMYGVGCALAYTPSLAILGHYFKRYLGVVNGIVTSGSSTFTMLMPYVIGYFLQEAGLAGTMRLLAVIASVIMCCAVVFKPATTKKISEKKNTLKRAFNVSIWKNKKYVIWAAVIAVSLCGYFVPYVHMSIFVKNNFPKDTDAKLPIICIGITSGLGRLIFGYIADLPKVNRIYLQQLSFLSIGILTMLLPETAGSFNWLLVITLGMGLFDGCFISLLGPIAFDLCGQEGATQAIGFLLGLCSIPLTLGPYLAGILYDHLGNYDLALRLAGIPPIGGALLMFLIRCVESRPVYVTDPSSVEPLKAVNCDEKAHQEYSNGGEACSETHQGRKNEECPVNDARFLDNSYIV